ncbi:uncharacterized protein LOC111133007 [Crassostrea virginica]
MFSKRALLSLFCLAVGISTTYAALGGGSCSIPTPGSPGASTICTGSANGFCLIDTLGVTGTNPVTSVTLTGVCVCYYGYSGPQCATFTPTTTTTTTTTNNNAITALVLGGLAAYALTTSGASTGLSTGLGLGSLNAQDILYLQQAGLTQ